jgi:hypothetical protein
MGSNKEPTTLEILKSVKLGKNLNDLKVKQNKDFKYASIDAVKWQEAANNSMISGGQILPSFLQSIDIHLPN